MEKYSKDPSITEFMEMPCKCSCGNWHELDDGKLPPGVRSGNVVCPECYNKQVEEGKCPECLDVVGKEELDMFGGLCEYCTE